MCLRALLPIVSGLVLSMASVSTSGGRYVRHPPTTPDRGICRPLQGDPFRLSAWYITKLKVDAIVNAANERLAVLRNP